jgi:septum formation protein
MKGLKIILASASPRRRDLMRNAGLDFEVCPSDGPEVFDDRLTVEKAVENLACQKARSVAEKHPGACVVGADTVVLLDGKILGKPRDEADAARMLKLLSGKTHKVCTGVCIIKNGKENAFTEETAVEFYPLTDEEIDNYVASGEPMDKAGAYGIQGLGCVNIKGIQGDYFNVVGLPVARVVRTIRE